MKIKKRSSIKKSKRAVQIMADRLENDWKTNIDAVIGESGIVRRRITKYEVGLVKVGYELWRAKADEDIEEGEEVEVIGVSGVTLEVKRVGGG